MEVHVRLFAALREALGTDRLTRELPEGATGAALRDSLAAEHPRWRDLIASCRLAVGTEFVDDDAPLAPAAEVVLIPPVSGGSGEDTPLSVALTREPLDGEALRRAAVEPGTGAVVHFEGTVRTPSLGKDVEYLEYEAYEEMALERMRAIVQGIVSGTDARRAFLHHRLGRIQVGETSVVAVASAPHRGEAFEACRAIIERLKVEVPIWKKEVFADGSEWVGAPGECAEDPSR